MSALLTAIAFAKVCLVAAWLPLNCTFTVPAGCGCPGGTTGTLEAKSNGAFTATLKADVNGTGSNKNVLKNSSTTFDITLAGCTSTTLRCTPQAGYTWDTVDCDHLNYIC